MLKINLIEKKVQILHKNSQGSSQPLHISAPENFVDAMIVDDVIEIVILDNFIDALIDEMCINDEVSSGNTRPKTSTERSREFRARKKLNAIVPGFFDIAPPIIGRPKKPGYLLF